MHFVENQPPHRGGDFAVGPPAPRPARDRTLIGARRPISARRSTQCALRRCRSTRCRRPCRWHRFLGQVVAAHHHIQRRRYQRLAGRRRQHIVGAQHHRAGFVQRQIPQRDVHRHLVAVKVGIERRADQRMQLDCATLNQLWLESLDAQTVQRRRPVQQHRPVA